MRGENIRMEYKTLLDTAVKTRYSKNGIPFVHQPPLPAYPPVYPVVWNFNQFNTWRDKFDKVCLALDFYLQWTYQRRDLMRLTAWQWPSDHLSNFTAGPLDGFHLVYTHGISQWLSVLLFLSLFADWPCLSCMQNLVWSSRGQTTTLSSQILHTRQTRPIRKQRWSMTNSITACSYMSFLPL